MARYPHLCPLALALLAGLAGCSSADDDGTASVDANATPCAEQQPLRIGHCVDDGADGMPCTNFGAPTRRFVEFADGDSIDAIIGFQGSPMFVMAVEGDGIADGEGLDGPFVSVQISAGDYRLGGYQNHPVLEAVGEAMRAQQLYVVFYPTENEGEGSSLHVEAAVEDRTGAMWCAERNFKMGETIMPLGER